MKRYRLSLHVTRPSPLPKKIPLRPPVPPFHPTTHSSFTTIPYIPTPPDRSTHSLTIRKKCNTTAHPPPPVPTSQFSPRRNSQGPPCDAKREGSRPEVWRASLDNLAFPRPLSNGQYSIIRTSLHRQTTKSEALLRHAVGRGWTNGVRQRPWKTRPMGCSNGTNEPAKYIGLVLLVVWKRIRFITEGRRSRVCSSLSVSPMPGFLERLFFFNRRSVGERRGEGCVCVCV